MAKWYEFGEVGESLRETLDFWDTETFVARATELGLSPDEIEDVLQAEEE